MRTVIQRVRHADVRIAHEGWTDLNGLPVSGKIENGLMLLVGFIDEDTDEDLMWIAKKVSMLRIFDDENGVMNKSVMDVGGDFLVVSQFTLMAATAKGNRPSYIRAARQEVSEPLYERFVKMLREYSGLKVETGVFGADMKVTLLNDGPVTIIMDSKERNF